MKKIRLKITAVLLMLLLTAGLCSCELFANIGDSDDGEIVNGGEENPKTNDPTEDETDPPAVTEPPECKHENTYVWEGKPSTCTQLGYTEYEVCNSCGVYVREKEEIPKLAHEYEKGDGLCDNCSYVRGLDWYDEAKTEYTLNTVDEFIDFRNLVNRQTTYTAYFEGKTVKLGADIDLGGMEWLPISCFKGTFDGQGHKISNFKITSDILTNVGIFGRNEGTVKDIGIEKFTININKDKNYLYVGALVGENAGDIENCYSVSKDKIDVSAKGTYAGGLVGRNYGKITDCFAEVDVSAKNGVSAGGLAGYVYSGVITNSYALGNVDLYFPEGQAYVGGLVGYGGMMSAEYANCYASGNVKAVYTKPSDEEYNSGRNDDAYVGGLIGYIRAGAIITKSYATGDVSSEYTDKMISRSDLGGLIGFGMSLTAVSECYATGNVISATSMNESYAGGLIGYFSGNELKYSFASGDVIASVANSDATVFADGLAYCESGNIAECYVSNSASVKKLVGETENIIYDSNKATKIAESNFKSVDWLIKNVFITESNVWTVDGGYPTLNYDYINKTVIKISTADQLRELQGKILVLDYEISSDINFNGGSWNPIFAIMGTLDGGEHTVSNFICDTVNVTYYSSYSGFILYNTGTVKDLNIKDGGYTDSLLIGGLVVSNVLGKVENCYVDSDISTSIAESVSALVGCSYGGEIINCRSSGSITVNGKAYQKSIGGLVAVTSSGSSATQTLIYNCSSDVRIDIKCTEDTLIYSGGLVGVSYYVQIENSYAKVDIYFYSSFGGGSFGGLIGYADESTLIKESYADGTIVSKGNAQIYSGGLMGSATNATVENSYFNGTIDALSTVSGCYAGGLVGYINYNESVISSSYAKGSVKAVSSNNISYAGGLVGYNDVGQNLQMDSCFANCSVSATAYTDDGAHAGYILGADSAADIKNSCYYEGMSVIATVGNSSVATLECKDGTSVDGGKVNSSAFYKEVLGWSEEVWDIKDGSLPTLK